MADQLTQAELNELRQLHKELRSGQDFDLFFKSFKSAKDLRDELVRFRKEWAGLNSDVTYFSDVLKNVISDLSKQNSLTGSTKKAFSTLGSIANKLKYDQDGITRLSKKELDSLKSKTEIQKKILEGNQESLNKELIGINNQLRRDNLSEKERRDLKEKQRLIGALANETNGFLTGDVYNIQQFISALNERIEKEKLSNKALGISGVLINGIDKTLNKLGLGGLINLQNIKEKMQEAADAAADKGNVTWLDRLKVAIVGLKESFKELKEQLKDPVVQFKLLYDSANKADQQTTQLAKSMMQTKFAAMQTREQIVGMANASGDAFITTEKLLEATAALGKQLGFNKIFSRDITQTFVDLTKKIGLSEEAAGGLAKISIATGRTLKATEQIIAGTTSRISAQNGIQLDGKDILEEVGKISGQLLANFKGNPAALAEAVAQTKALGTNLEQTRNQSEKLLDFETSIGNQLKGELLTGQQINLERARTFALQGNQVGVAKELSNQGMNFYRFSRLNVIQQKAFAEALGLSADQLTNQLLQQDAIGKSRSEIVALAGEEAAKRLEALAAQDKFNASVDKLKDLFSNIVGGPLGTVIDILSDAVGLVGKLISGIQYVLGNTLMKGVLGAAAGLYVGGPLGALIGGAAGLASGIASKADDMVGYGARALVTPSGTIALNNNDTVIAGTKLSKGNDVISLPEGSIGNNNNETNNLLRELINTTRNQSFGVDINGRSVGTEIYRATYKSA